MMRTAPVPTAARRARAGALVLVLVSALTAGALALPAAMASLSPISVTDHATRPAAAGAGDGVVDGADGMLPQGATAFDDLAGVSRLDPALLDALRRATEAAAREGVQVRINSGWRSPEYQELLRTEAVTQYGSEAEAARWVASASTSTHVAGMAVDIGSYAAVDWMSQEGARYGLCQTYSNEAWHFELQPAAVARGCAEPYADPTQDPRLQE